MRKIKNPYRAGIIKQEDIQRAIKTVKSRRTDMSVTTFPTEVWALNEQWFKEHGHLTNKEMIKEGLIDSCDLFWVNYYRKKYKIKS